MAAGALTLTNYGVYNCSGAALKTRVDATTITTKSGAAFLIPCGDGQSVFFMKIEQAES
jgi:hypothetical protein